MAIGKWVLKEVWLLSEEKKANIVICNSFQSNYKGSLTLWKVGRWAKF